MTISITSAMQMSDAPFADATEANTDEQLDQLVCVQHALDSELWSPPPNYFQVHSSAVQYPRTGGLVDIDKQTPVSPERFNEKGEKTAVRGLPNK